MSDDDVFEVREDVGHADAGCLSDLALDRLLADEDRGGGLRARLDACEHCQERFAELVSARAAYLEANPPHLRASLIAAAAKQAEVTPALSGLWQRLRDWRIVAPLSAALGAVVVLLLVTRGSGDRGETDLDIVRLKGGERFSVLVKDADGSFRRANSDVPIAPGTSLGFRVFCTDRCRVTIVGIGDAGEGYIVDGERTLATGQARNLDFTVELDDSRGDERFYAAFCRDSIEPGELVRQLERAYPSEVGAGRNVAKERDVRYDTCVLQSRLVVRAE